MSLNSEERALLRRTCSRHVIGFTEETPAQLFAQMAAYCEAEKIEHDVYGEGKLIESFEAKIAKRLGKPAAVFMPSGVMAQLIALRIWTERAALPRFGMHASSHLVVHEEQAYEALFNLHGVMVGAANRIITGEDVLAVRQRLACLLIELPMRELGGLLPSWDELQTLKKTAAAAGIPLHMDGARLWECGAFYGKPYDEIADGFDSVYVSMYKGIGAVAGAVLAGDAAFIGTARKWQRRLGGTLVHQSPMIVSAAMRIDQRLALLPACYARTVAFAQGLGAIEGVRLLPAVPQTNMVHVFFNSPPAALLDARDAIAKEDGIWLLGQARSADVPGWSRAEIYVGDQLLKIDQPAIARAFQKLMALAAGAASASA